MIYFFYGENYFEARKKTEEIILEFQKNFNNKGIVQIFDFSDSEPDIEQLISNARTQSLFFHKRLIILKYFIENENKFSKAKEFFVFLTGIKEDKDIQVVFLSGEVKKSASKMAKKILSLAKKAREFKLLNEAALLKWIRNRFEEKSTGKVKISHELGKTLIAFCGNDQHLLSNEIEKIINWKSKGEVSKEDIELLVSAKISADIFKMVDALAEQNKALALKLLFENIDAGKHPLYILSMFLYQFRNLVGVSSALKNSVSKEAMIAKLDVHPYVAQKCIRQAGHFSNQKLKKAFLKLCEIDYEAKTGKKEIKFELEKFIASF